MVRGYAETDGCRRAFLLGYFGEAYEPPCGACDVCLAGGGAPDPAAAEGAPRVGARVAHGTWGEGLISHVEDGHITVVFDTVGYRTLDMGLVAERGLLQLVDGAGA
jgi:ATP-dependent DNA helicase RecQ